MTSWEGGKVLGASGHDWLGLLGKNANKNPDWRQALLPVGVHNIQRFPAPLSSSCCCASYSSKNCLVFLNPFLHPCPLVLSPNMGWQKVLLALAPA